jgi:hypothetical protein
MTRVMKWWHYNRVFAPIIALWCKHVRPIFSRNG